MAEKKFAGLNGPVESAEVCADYEAAQVFDRLKVGKLGVYYREGFKTRFLRYAEMERAFLRVQEVRGRMCCGRAFWAYFRMVFVCGGKEYDDVMSEDEQLMRDALAAVAAAGLIVAEGEGESGMPLVSRLPELYTAAGRLLKVKISEESLLKNNSNRVYMPANGEL